MEPARPMRQRLRSTPIVTTIIVVKGLAPGSWLPGEPGAERVGVSRIVAPESTGFELDSWCLIKVNHTQDSGPAQRLRRECGVGSKWNRLRSIMTPSST